MRLQAAAFLALALVSSVAAPAFAGEGAATQHVERAFLIPANDGYGTGECLTNGKSECGQVVANAWCESQGFASAASYGVADRDEYTGSIDATPVRPATERPIRITCQD
ncbi:hypothetical protein [Methylobacterium gnaphalii]|uniref:Uncharacterized protein n=1 Tax=Methylobacterium gnaphalii TaxID=1010610 RepID=A0A512JGJ4_9HYPH|nr:hypothetical protein [Methylobacterium gnaphalii]GEP08962.1 hypothetical protein MGN01_08070 [Methylobacterium gnaphalii]GJD67505.1 hypothetical protein MMMDOFMJ_0420 [Methylobacterium gnaphalii]GLS48195.1 hypothetical protein GCM10007885_10390 [Methylobacterium gnaphalii]